MAADDSFGDVPKLHVVGRRGWNNEAVFAFMESSPLMGKTIVEETNLDDVRLAKLIAGCAGLVFPSHVEGYGLPALEAAQMGVPVICSDLPVFREILGDYGIFVPVDDRDGWIKAVTNVVKMHQNGDSGGANAREPLAVPRWQSHFGHVFGDTRPNRHLASIRSK